MVKITLKYAIGAVLFSVVVGGTISYITTHYRQKKLARRPDLIIQRYDENRDGFLDIEELEKMV